MSKLSVAVKSILAGTVLTLASSSAFAAGAVGPNDLGALGANSKTISATFSNSSATSWFGGTGLDGDAWAHTGKWFTFDVTAANQNVSIDIAGQTGDLNLAFTVWASGSSVFDGGTSNHLEVPNCTACGGNAPHSFNQVGQIGDNGTLWASGDLGNLQETLAYANAGGTWAHTGYGETIKSGINQVATDNKYFAGSVTGSTTSASGSTHSEDILNFKDLAVGYYTIFVGGSGFDPAATKAVATPYTITLTSTTAVPEPTELSLFSIGLLGMAAVARKKQKSA
jgi:hypothetical protein